MASFEFKSGNFQPSGGEQAFGGVHAEMHAPALAPTGAEAHALVGPPHALLPGIPGASEPISPLIQLIMRMPGHLGLLSSLFEAVQNMILPHVDVLGQLGHFDFSTLVGHGHVLTALSDHVPVDLSAMSTDPHILHSLQEGVAGGGHVGDLSKLQLHADTTASYTKSALNVSGTVDLNKPQFEGAGSVGKGSALAPPGISEVSPSNHLAGVQRIFSQKLFEGVAPPNASASMTSSVSSVPTSAPTSAPSSLGDLHASAQGFQPHLEAARAGGGITDGAVYGAPSADASSFGPSGGVSDTLGAKHVLGNSDVAPPSSNAVGGPEYSTPQEVAQPIGLKAKELSLASIDKVPAASHAPVTHLTHHMSPTKIAMTNAVQHSGAASGAQPAVHSAQAGAPHSAQTPSTHAVHDQIVHGQPHKVQYDDHARATGSSGQPAQADAPANSQANAQPADATQTTDAPANPEAVESYTIRSGDCLWNIAKDHLGNAMRWQDIYKLNMDQIGTNPDLIHPGVNLHMPSDGQSIAQGVTDGGKYVVQSGDNLWNISSKLLGSGTKWGELYKLNADVIGNNPRLIMPGQELTLPGADSSHMLANAAPTQTAATAAAAPQAAGAPQVSAAPEAPAAPVAHAAPAPHDAYAAQAPDTSKILKVDATPDHVLTGPGGAQAADLDAAAAAASNVAGDKSIVSPSLAPDLSFLKRKV
jgi:nucleoid-associated protein YgaU